MLTALAAWCALLAVVYVFFYIREVKFRRGIDVAKEQVKMLNDQKDQQLKLVEQAGRERIGVIAKDDLTAVLNARPRWSGVLDAITKGLPTHVWLESVVVVPGDKDNPDSVSIKGKTKSQKSLTDFIIKIESGGRFVRSEVVRAKLADATNNIMDFEMTTTPILKKF